MRLFVAVWPAPQVVDALRAALERPALPGVRWTGPDQWHITMHFLGNVGAEDVPALSEALASVGGACAPRLCMVGPATATFGRSVLMVAVSGLEDVAAATVAATSSFGEPPEDRPFAGHVTLARSGGRRSRGTDLRPFRGREIAAEWPVDEVTLVRSFTTREGARYEVLARFGLG